MRLWEEPEECVFGSCADHYAISSVYFAEVCVLNHVCRNGKRLFELEVGELFECDLDVEAFVGLRGLLA